MAISRKIQQITVRTESHGQLESRSCFRIETVWSLKHLLTSGFPTSGVARFSVMVQTVSTFCHFHENWSYLCRLPTFLTLWIRHKTRRNEWFSSRKINQNDQIIPDSLGNRRDVQTAIDDPFLSSMANRCLMKFMKCDNWTNYALSSCIYKCCANLAKKVLELVCIWIPYS